MTEFPFLGSREKSNEKGEITLDSALAEVCVSFVWLVPLWFSVCVIFVCQEKTTERVYCKLQCVKCYDLHSTCKQCAIRFAASTLQQRFVIKILHTGVYVFFKGTNHLVGVIYSVLVS